MDPNSAIDPVKLGAAALTMPVSTPKAGNAADGQFQKLLDQYAAGDKQQPAQTQGTTGKDQSASGDRSVYTEKKDAVEHHEDAGKGQDDPLEQMKKLAEYGYALTRPEGSLGTLTLNGQEYQNGEYYIGWKDDYCVVIPDTGLDPEQLDQILNGQSQIFEEGDDLSGVLVKFDDPLNKDAGVHLTEQQLSAGEPVVDSTVAQTEAVPEVKEELPAEPQPSEPKEEEVKAEVTGGEHVQTVFRNLQSAPIKVGDSFGAGQVRAEDVNDQIAQKVIPAAEQGQTRVELQLNPEALGAVKVEITQGENGVLHVAISAQNSEARSLLERNADGLQSLLAARSQAPVQVEVQRGESQPDQSYDGHNGHPSQQQQQQRNSDHAQSSQDFLHQLRLGLVEETDDDV